MAAGAGPVESEIKLPVEDLGPIRHRLAAAGATLVQAVTREHNTLYDFAGAPLASSQQALRLRRYGGTWLLTFKGKASYQGQVKHREELQTAVSDGNVMTEILCRLGLVPSISYQKDRELWRLAGVEICLDQTPIGDFVELEGPPELLPELADQLELDLAAAVRGSYLSLWQSYRLQHPDKDLPQDMLFADEHPA